MDDMLKIAYAIGYSRAFADAGFEKDAGIGGTLKKIFGKKPATGLAAESEFLKGLSQSKPKPLASEVRPVPLFGEFGMLRPLADQKYIVKERVKRHFKDLPRATRKRLSSRGIDPNIFSWSPPGLT